MKKSSKILALALTLALLLCLCACGSDGTRSLPGGLFSQPKPETFEGHVQLAEEQMKELKSFHMDMSMDLRMKMKLMGQSFDTDVIADYGMDTEQEPLKIAMEIKMEMSSLGQHESQNSLIYVVQEGNEQYVTYTSVDNGKTWQKQSGSLPEAVQQDTGKQMALFLSCGESFRETGKRTVNGEPAIEYQGELKGDFVQQAIESSGALGSLGELLGSEVPEDLFRDLGAIPVTVAFDEASGRMVFYEMDMTESMGVLMQRLMGSMMQSFGIEGLELEMSVAKISATLSKFDQVSVSVPAAAQAA